MATSRWVLSLAGSTLMATSRERSKRSPGTRSTSSFSSQWMRDCKCLMRSASLLLRHRSYSDMMSVSSTPRTRHLSSSRTPSMTWLSLRRSIQALTRWSCHQQALTWLTLSTKFTATTSRRSGRWCRSTTTQSLKRSSLTHLSTSSSTISGLVYSILSLSSRTTSDASGSMMRRSPLITRERYPSTSCATQLMWSWARMAT